MMQKLYLRKFRPHGNCVPQMKPVKVGDTPKTRDDYIYSFREGTFRLYQVQDIVEGVVKHQDDIDKSISDKLSEKWSLKRLDLTLRAILRAAGYEIQRRPDVPALVIIDQYVSIASDFFEGKEPGFVNGALDKMAKEVRKAEFGLVGHG